MAASASSSSSVLRAYLNGRTVAACIKETASTIMPLYSPVTSKLRHTFAVSSKAQVHDAVTAASEAQTSWATDYSPAARASVLLAASRLLTSHTKELAHLETIDTGRPLTETLADITSATDCLTYYAGLAPTLGGQALDLGTSWGYTRREPLGTTAGIGAWNYPLQSAVWKSAPALAFGNSMVFKPSEATPLTALRLAELYTEAGIPPGVFNVVLGARETGAALVAHPSIDKVSFTGSVETGIAVATSAAAGLKKVTMELGGKSPLIIFDDADVTDAVSAAMMANWYSSGQVCSNGTRVFVHRPLKEAFLTQLIARTEALVLGDPMTFTTDIGPMISATHRETVQAYITTGVAEGATLVSGAAPLSLPVALSAGNFIRPAIFTNCHDDMRIVTEEVFGMLMCVLEFDDEEEVIRRANHTRFGLSAGVFTNDLKRGHRVVSALKAGTTWLNNYNLAPVELPWGGMKHSGLGRENGLAGADSWTQLKSVYVEMNHVDCPYT